MTTQAQQFTGSWEKVSRSACAERYPGAIEFRETGSYVGRSEPAGMFTFWDVGTFEVVDDAHVRISTANDAIISYEFSVRDETLTFRDPEGCEVQYRRREG